MPVNDLPIRPGDPAEHAERDEHVRHDELLLVAYADGTLSDPETAAVAALVASCPACARLVEDVGLLRTALQALPAPARPRDFRLSEADATRLLRTGWRRLAWPFVAPFGTPRLAFTRPLAGALVTIGLAGILVTAAPDLLQSPARTLSAVGGSAVGGSAAMPESASNDAAGAAGAFGAASGGPAVASGPAATAGAATAGGPATTAAPSPASAPLRAAASAAPAATLPAGVTGPPVPGPTGGDVTAKLGSSGNAAATGSPSPAEAGPIGAATVPMGVESPGVGPPPVLLGGLVLLVFGLALVLLRLAARRLA